MKKPYLKENERILLFYHRKGYKTIWGALTELELARRKLCREIQKQFKWKQST